MALFYSKLTNDCQDPESSSLSELQTYLATMSKGQLAQYDSDDTHDFRMLEPKRGPIDKSVKILMPLHWLGRWIVVSGSCLLLSPLPFVRNACSIERLISNWYLSVHFSRNPRPKALFSVGIRTQICLG